jgi:uncharacterized membrane protein YfcA
MDYLQIIGYLGAALTGLVLGILGGGGAIFSVPVLVYIFHVKATEATAYSMFIVAIAAAIGAVQNIRKKMVEWNAVAWYGVPSLITVFITRKFIIHAIPEDLFTLGTYTFTKHMGILLLLSLVMVIIGYKMTQPAAIQDDERGINRPKLVIYAVAIGLFLGVVGAGGGFLMIPALIHFANLDIKKAVGTSLVLVSANAAIGFLGDATTNTHMNWPLLTSFAGIAIAGVIAGTYYAHRINPGHLRKGFGYFMIATAAFIFVKEIFF